MNLGDAPVLPASEVLGRIGIGTARLGAFWQRRSPVEGLRALNLALDLGITLVDTADVYARGVSERLVGRAVANRPDVTVITKVGLVKTPVGLRRARRAGAQVGSDGLAREGAASTCFEPRYLKESTVACLRRQQRDALDVLLLHEPDRETLGRVDVAETLDTMRTRGTIGAWGASVRSLEAAVAALDIPGLGYLQVPVNLVDTSIADAIERHPARAGVTVIGLAVLGDGAILSSATAAGIPRSRAVASLTTGAACVPGVDAVLLGMSRPEHVLANIRALEQGVSRTDIDEVRSAVSGDPR